MNNSLLAVALVPFLAAGVCGQAASSPVAANPPDVMNATMNHARDPVGFEVLDKRESDGVYPDDVVSTVRARWYQLVSELRQASYDQQGVTVVEFRIKRDGSLGKAAISETSNEARLDGAALNAVRSASPFKPLPKDFEPKSMGFRIHLGYNQPTPGDPCPTILPGVYEIHHGVTTPRAMYTPDPEYSEDARKAKYQGTAILGLTVGGDGLPYDICVLNALGHGLDEKAIEAIKHWKFDPGMKDGDTVAVRLSVETTFRLY
jgi:TonB family protein